MVLNLTKEEAVALRHMLRQRRRQLLFARDYRRWREWPAGTIYARLCKLLRYKR